MTLYFQLAPRFFEPAAHPYARLAVDAVTMLFWFAGFIAIGVLASALRAWDYDWDAYGYTNSGFYRDAAACAAIGALEWCVLLFQTESGRKANSYVQDPLRRHYRLHCSGGLPRQQGPVATPSQSRQPRSPGLSGVLSGNFGMRPTRRCERPFWTVLTFDFGAQCDTPTSNLPNLLFSPLFWTKAEDGDED